MNVGSRRRLKLGLLSVGLLAVLATHARVERADHSLLLRLDGRPVDALGAWKDLRNRMLRRCSGVQVARLDPADADAQAVLAALQAYSPPDSASARLHHLQRSGDWWLAQVQFDSLEPATVLLRAAAAQPQVVDTALWSGPTEPWRPGPLIRQYLAARAPDVPGPLLACADPDPALFERRLRG